MMVSFRPMDEVVLINEVVINEVRSRECLWNPRNVYYKNETDKYKAWEEVSVAVLPKYTTCSEDDKGRIVRAVQSRWKTALDAYMKCRLTEIKKPTYKARLQRHIYNKLKFLEHVKHIDEGVNNRVNVDEEGSTSFLGDNSASQSTFTVCDYDVGGTSDEVLDTDIHDDFKDKIKDVATAVDCVDDNAVSDNSKQECLPETSSQNQKSPLATADVTKLRRKRPRVVRTRKLKSNMTEKIKKIMKIISLKNRTSANSSALQTDDQLFFSSLGPIIDNFDFNQKLKLRSKILEAGMEIRKSVP